MALRGGVWSLRRRKGERAKGREKSGEGRRERGIDGEVVRGGGGLKVEAMRTLVSR